MINWCEIKYFRPCENWGDPDKILPEAMKTLDELNLSRFLAVFTVLIEI